MTEQMNTPEQAIVTEPEYAGFWIRFAAHIIDWLVLRMIKAIVFIPIVLTIIFSAAFSFSDFNWNNFDFDNFEFSDLHALGWTAGVILLILLFVFLTIVIEWLYYALMTSSKSQATLGKMAVGVKVTDLNGERISFLRATGRYFSKIISEAIFWVGYIMAGFTDRKQGLHDFIASTYVVYNKKI